jgi:hypothetical protein
VSLTATPASSSFAFGGWGGDCAGQGNPCSLIMNSSKTVSATFNASGGGGFTQITSSTGATTGSLGGNFAPSINADGIRIAFESNRDLISGNPDSNREIFLWTAGSGLTQLTSSNGGGNANVSPSISADGARIAFSSDRNLTGGNADGNLEIFLWTSGSGITQLTNTTGGFNLAPSINADGTRIAFFSNRDLTGSNADLNTEIFLWTQGSGLTQLTNSTGGGSSEPSINADGTRIAFSSNNNLTGGNADGGLEIFLWTHGSGLTQLTNFTGGDSTNPSINADGTKIAFLSTADLTGGNPDGNSEIFLATLPALPATTLAAAVLPTERTGLVGGAHVTAFATILNTGPVPATGCAIAPLTPVAATFLYQTTDPTNALTGSPNTPVDIPAGGAQSFLLALTPTAPFAVTELAFSFACTNSAPAPSIAGVNTFRLRATTTPAPDPVALVAVGPPNDGILRLASTGAFAVATVNVGAPGLLTVSAEAGALPVTISVCETNSQTGQCLAPPSPSVQAQINAGATPTFGVFVSADTPIPFDPATNRIQVHLEGGGGTSVAVCTAPLCP